MGGAQEQLDTRALETAVAVEARISAHEDRCTERWEQLRADRREFRAEMQKAHETIHARISDVKRTLARLPWMVAGTCVSVIVLLLGGIGTLFYMWLQARGLV
jgi:hypothetical protein